MRTHLRILRKTWGLLACVVLLAIGDVPGWLTVVLAGLVMFWIYCAEGLTNTLRRQVAALKELDEISAGRIKDLERYRQAFYFAARQRRDGAK